VKNKLIYQSRTVTAIFTLHIENFKWLLVSFQFALPATKTLKRGIKRVIRFGAFIL